MWGGVLSLETWIQCACGMGRSVLGEPYSEPPAWGEFAGAPGARAHNSLLHDSRACPWTPQPLGWRRGSRLITWDTLDHVGHAKSRAERRPATGAAAWGVLCGVSPPNSTAAPQALPPRAPSSWVCSQAAAAAVAVSYIKKGGVKKKKGPVQQIPAPQGGMWNHRTHIFIGFQKSAFTKSIVGFTFSRC